MKLRIDVYKRQALVYPEILKDFFESETQVANKAYPYDQTIGAVYPMPTVFRLNKQDASGKMCIRDSAYSVYTRLDLLETQLRRIFKEKAIPVQPTNKKGKPYHYFIYNSCIVSVNDVEHVEEVQRKLTDMGFQASSNADWMKQSEQQSNMIQAVLGGIGAVSLFVAAIEMCIRDSTNSVAYVLKHYGISVKDKSTLNVFVGPPLVESFMKYYGFDREQARASVEIYREYFEDKGCLLYTSQPQGIPGCSSLRRH